jgi:hypothetical protein
VQVPSKSRTTYRISDPIVEIGFISSSSTKKIEARLDELLGAGTTLRKAIS